MRSFRHSKYVFLLVSALLAITGCGSGSGTTGTCNGGNCPATFTVSSVSPASGATGVAVNSAVTAAFNLPLSSSTLSSSTFTLSAGSTPVAGAVTYSSTTNVATFTPAAALAFSTTYTATLSTAVTDTTGSALSSPYSWTFTTQAAPAPTVTSTSPASGATGVPVGVALTATFSEEMNASTLTASSFTLSSSSGSVSGSVTYSSANNTATFTPAAALAYGTQYTAAITTAAASSGGTALAAAQTWTFTTVAAPVPTVTSTTPASGATGVAVGAPLTATFSEAMDPATLTSSTFLLQDAANNPVSGTVTYAGDTATFTPAAALSYSTTYTAMITTGAKSSNEAALASGFTWIFTTAAAPAAPQVSSTTPASGAAGIAVNTTVTATFNEPIQPSSLGSSTFTVSDPGGAVAGAVSLDPTGMIATFTPSANLAYGTVYTATLTSGIMNTTGQALASPVVWSFTTIAVPAVDSTTPAGGATSVSVTSPITAAFSMAMNAATINGTTFTLSSSSGSVAGAVTYSSGTDTATFTPSASLAYNTLYTATITTGAQNSGNVPLAANDTWTFTTEAVPSGMVTVDYSAAGQDQLIRGFGGSTAWLGVMPSSVAKALFNPTSGLGLSILRVRIDPEGSAAGGGAYGFPWETSQWDQEATNGAEAVANNPNAIVFATPWTPPAAWKLNGSSSVSDQGTTWNESFASCSEGTGYCGGYLDLNHYADYANYLEDFVTFFDSVNSFDLYAISMQNEPDSWVTYESCTWTPDQMDSWIASDGSTIASDGFGTKLIMPESEDFNPVLAKPALNDASAQGLISIIGGHIYQYPYYGSIVPYSIPSGDSPKELWMTEFGPLSSAALSWNTALDTYGLSIHDSMVNAQYDAYVWWGLFGYSTGSCATSAGTCGLVDNSGNLMPMGYVMGQFSKFIQPGYYRYNATPTPATNVYVSAYASSGNYVIVAINSGATAVTQPFTIQGATVSSVTPWQSTSSAGLQQQTAVSVSGGQFSYTLPAQSITTFVSQ